MSFAENLIDGLDVVYKHSQNNTKAYSELREFLKKMSDIRKEYSKKMTSVIADYRQKKIATQNCHFYGTVKDAIETYLNCLEEDINKDNTITQIENQATKDFETQIKELEKQSKNLINEGNKMTKAIEQQKETLKKEKEKFIKLSKEADQATINVEKAMQDPSTKVNKMQQLTNKKDQAIDKAKEADNQYRACVQETNNKIHDYYTSQQPNILSQFQSFEEQCVNTVKGLFNKFGLAFNALPDAANKFVEYTKSKFDAIDADADINTFATTKATNGHLPEDIPIEDANGNILFEGNAHSAPVNNTPTFASIPKEHRVEEIDEEQGEEQQNEEGMEKCNVQVKALYDYAAEADSELTIREGETLVITEKHASGWWFATNGNGESGFVPENFVEAL